MAGYDPRQIVSNIERSLSGDQEPEAPRAASAPANGSARTAPRLQPLANRLEAGPMGLMRTHHAVDKLPEGTGLRGVKALLMRVLRLVAAPQAAFNYNTVEALRTTALQADVLAHEVEELQRLHREGMEHLTKETQALWDNMKMRAYARDVEEMRTRDIAQLHQRVTDETKALWAAGEHTAKELEQRPRGEDLDVLSREVRDLNASITDQVGAVWRGVEERDAQLRLTTSATQSLQHQTAGLETSLKELRARLLQAAEQVAIMEERLEAGVPAQASAPAAVQAHDHAAPAPAPAAANEDPSLRRKLDLAYLRFQRQFRGDEEDLRRRQQRYVDLIRGAFQGRSPRVLDLACGDGIFVELLQQNGIAASGVDINEAMVKVAAGRGLAIMHGDALAFLETEVEQRYDVVTAFQFVEHLQPYDLMRLLRGAHRVLRPDGLLILETINPHTIKSLHWFHLDLTHARLLFPEMAQVLAETANFVDTRWEGINPVEDSRRLVAEGAPAADQNVALLNEFLFGPQDYYLCARKPGVK